MAAVIFVAIVGFVPLQTTVAVPATVHEKGRVAVVAPQSALLDTMPPDGSHVEKGQILFRLRAADHHVIVESPASGTIVFARDWIHKAPVAAGETLGSVITGYMIEGDLPQRWVEDARKARSAKSDRRRPTDRGRRRVGDAALEGRQSLAGGAGGNCCVRRESAEN